MDGRRCTWCGAENAGDAESCSSCGARFAPAAVSRPAAPEGWAQPIPPPPASRRADLPMEGSWSGMPSTDRAPAPAARTGPRKPLILAGALVALVAAGFVVKTMLFRPAISFPDTLAGLSRNDSKVAQGITDFVENLADQYGFPVHVGLYGSSDFQPELMVIAFERGDAPPGVFDDFASGFTSTSGETVGEPVVQQLGEVEYRCASLQPTGTATGTAQSLCQWTDPDTGGFLISGRVAEPSAAVGFAAQVHDAVVR